MTDCLRKAAKDLLGELKEKGAIEKDTWWWNEDIEKKRKFLLKM